MPPQTLKSTQVSVLKWKATYQLATAIAAKKTIHDQVTADHTAGGSERSFSTAAIQSRRNTSLPTASTVAEQPVEHGGLPLDERLVLQQQRCAAEHADDDEREPVDGRDLAADLEVDDLQHRSRHRHRGGDVDARPLEGDEEQDQRQVIG